MTRPETIRHIHDGAIEFFFRDNEDLAMIKLNQDLSQARISDALEEGVSSAEVA